MHQRQPMWCAIRLSCRPSLIPASKPFLYVKAVMPVVSHSSGALCSMCLCVFVHMCLCLFMQEFICTCVLSPWQIYSDPNLHVSIGGDSGVVRDGEGPFERLPSFPSLSSRLQPTAPQPSWHLPPDKLNELKKIQWDTWCGSQGAPLLRCSSTQLCPQT